MTSTGRPSILNDQILLSEQLQLLNQFTTSKAFVLPDKEASQQFLQSRDANRVIRILDTIALVLTTGRPGEVFAAAFDRRQSLTLVLTKDDPVSPEDDLAVRELIRTITASTTKDASDVFPFLFSRCRENIERRIAKMLKALAAFSRDLDEILEDYAYLPGWEHPISFNTATELPDSERYRRSRYTGDEPEFAQVIRNLVTDMTRAGEAIDWRDVHTSANAFAQFVSCATILQKARFFLSLRTSPRSSVFTWQRRANHLNHRLSKVCQYHRGLNLLIRHAKRRFRCGISYRWVNIIGAGETALELVENPLQGRALSRASSDADILITQEDFNRLPKTFRDMDRWLDRRSLQTRLHAEIRIVLDLSNPSDVPSHHDHDCEQPIGCSKRSCLCCSLWIAAYNETLHTKWRMSSLNGKPLATWALPGGWANAPQAAGEKDGKSVVDEAVLRGVSEHLTRSLFKLFRRIEPLVDEDIRDYF